MLKNTIFSGNPYGTWSVKLFLPGPWRFLLGPCPRGPHPGDGAGRRLALRCGAGCGVNGAWWSQRAWTHLRVVVFVGDLDGVWCVVDGDDKALGDAQSILRSYLAVLERLQLSQTHAHARALDELLPVHTRTYIASLDDAVTTQTRTTEEASTRKSAKAHAGTFCALWPWHFTFWPKINGFSGRLTVEHFCVKSGDPSCICFWDIVRKNRQTNRQTNTSEYPTIVTAVGVIEKDATSNSIKANDQGCTLTTTSEIKENYNWSSISSSVLSWINTEI